MAVIIPIRDNPNYTLSIELEGAVYRIGVLYNARNDFWSLTLWDNNDILLVAGVKIVPNYPLLYNFKNELLPSGDLYCQVSDINVNITRDSFVTRDAVLLYISNEERGLI